MTKNAASQMPLSLEILELSTEVLTCFLKSESWILFENQFRDSKLFAAAFSFESQSSKLPLEVSKHLYILAKSSSMLQTDFLLRQFVFPLNIEQVFPWLGPLMICGSIPTHLHEPQKFFDFLNSHEKNWQKEIIALQESLKVRGESDQKAS